MHMSLVITKMHFSRFSVYHCLATNILESWVSILPSTASGGAVSILSWTVGLKGVIELCRLRFSFTVNTFRSNYYLKEKLPQAFMQIGWMEDDFKNLTARVWANLDNPIKRYDFSKVSLNLCMSPSQVALFWYLWCHNSTTV